MDNALITVHIVFGGIALVLGGIAALAKKGQKNHKISGKGFAAAMLICAASAIWVSISKNHWFLLAIGFFSAYLTISGFCVLTRDKAINTVVGMLGGASSLFLIILGIIQSSPNVILLAFGSLQLFFALQDLFAPPQKLKVITRHGARMGGAYIATITAFLVVNINFLPWYVLWFLPSVVGSILITRSLQSFGRKPSKPGKPIGVNFRKRW